MKHLLDFQNVSFGYERTPILEEVTFRVQQGEWIGIFGPNGGGKTTLLKLILGFLIPVTGQITRAPRTAISYVPQRLDFDRQFPISALEVVLGGRLKDLPWYGHFSKDDTEAAKEALNQVNLLQTANQPFGTLSGGQLQRVLLARALVSKPQLLLLDEPMAGVDLEAQKRMFDLLEELRGKMTILMVTHDLDATVGKLDRLLCVQRTVMPYKPEEVCRHFASGLYHPPLHVGEA